LSITNEINPDRVNLETVTQIFCNPQNS